MPKPMVVLPTDREIQRLVEISVLVNHTGSEERPLHTRIKDALADAAKYREIKELREQGVLPAELSRRFGISPFVLTHWTHHGSIPITLEPIFFGANNHSMHDFTPSHEKDIPLAYLLGQSLGRTKSTTRVLRSLEVCTADAAVAERFTDSTEAVFGVRPPIGPHANYPYAVEFDSAAFVRHFDAVTNQLSAIPWHHLGTRAEYISFLSGYLSSHAIHQDAKDRARDCITLSQSSDKGMLLEDLALLMYRLGMRPSFGIQSKTIAQIRIFEPDDLTLLLDEGCLNTKTKALAETIREKRLAKIAAGDVYHARDIEAAYDQFRYLTGKKRMPKLTAAKQLREQGSPLPLATMQPWKTITPPAVQKRAVLEEIARTHLDPTVIHYVYRELGGTVDEARAVATRYRLKDIAPLERFFFLYIGSMPADCATWLALNSVPLRYENGVARFDVPSAHYSEPVHTEPFLPSSPTPTITNANAPAPQAHRRKSSVSGTASRSPKKEEGVELSIRVYTDRVDEKRDLRRFSEVREKDDPALVGVPFTTKEEREGIKLPVRVYTARTGEQRDLRRFSELREQDDPGLVAVPFSVYAHEDIADILTDETPPEKSVRVPVFAYRQTRFGTEVVGPVRPDFAAIPDDVRIPVTRDELHSSISSASTSSSADLTSYYNTMGKTYLHHCLRDAGVPEQKRRSYATMKLEDALERLDQEHPITVKVNGFNLHVTRDAGLRYAASYNLADARALADSAGAQSLKSVIREDFVAAGKCDLKQVNGSGLFTDGHDYLLVERVNQKEFKVTHLGANPASLR
ncbi:MAG: hypothetical protein Q7R76_01450 [Candidatus Woesearchaeota archaeon]|nr:hypothetical protein [Candidatus Woesearchaeota archaeon]